MGRASSSRGKWYWFVVMRVGEKSEMHVVVVVLVVVVAAVSLLLNIVGELLLHCRSGEWWL